MTRVSSGNSDGNEMLISRNWLQRYVDLPENPREISGALTSLGFEVEALTLRGSDVSGVVVGEVRACAKHPEADRLQVCRVFDGQEEVAVVCGAPNVAAGQKVLFARVGAELPGGLKIKRAKLRGQESFGMICAEDELGLGTSHDGIVVLDPATPIGLSLQAIPGLCDALFEINVTPNRPDALGHLGVARELAARFGRVLKYPEEPVREGSGMAAKVSLEVLSPENCSRYVGRVIEGVQVGPSPGWLVKALASLGKKSINNVVDLTNFVLLEWSQPAHAFDLDCLAGRKIVVRPARPEETLKTLDGVERKLDARDLVIADGERAQVLAGVMGGESSGVTEATRNIFLEVAYFDPRAVRAQSRRHGLSSDSSYRFERGVDPLATARVCDYLAALIARWCGGQVAKGRVEFQSATHPVKPRQVALRPSRVAKVLGVTIPLPDLEKLLNAIEIQSLSQAGRGGESLAFQVPGFRGDVEREVDLIEEIARLMDYNAIPSALPSFPITAVALPPGEVLANHLRHTLCDLGLSEALSLRFTSRQALERLRLAEGDARRDFVALRNPLSEEWGVLPTTPLPALLQALERNQNTQEHDVFLFEISRAFFQRPRQGERDPGVREEPMLGVALMGEWKSEFGDGTPQPVGFARLKGLVENALESLPGGKPKLQWKFGSKTGFLHPVESAELWAEGTQEPLGVLGMLHPKTQSDFGLRSPVAVAEINLRGLWNAPRWGLGFKAYSTQTAALRDINVLVAEAFRHAEVLAALHTANSAAIPHLETVRLNSVYRGQGVESGHKALHYTFVYRHADRSLTDEEVNISHEQVKAKLLANSSIRIK